MGAGPIELLDLLQRLMAERGVKPGNCPFQVVVHTSGNDLDRGEKHGHTPSSRKVFPSGSKLLILIFF